MTAEKIYDQISEIQAGVRNLQARITYLEQRERDLQARHEDTEQRARTYERRADEFEAKADRLDEVEGLCEKLLASLDRLPLKMEDAGIIPGIVSFEIALYGTYDWQQVMDAKFALKAALEKEKKEKEEDG